MFEPQPRHRRRFISAAALATLALAALPLVLMAQAAPDAPGTQSSTERGVTVKVTPKSVGSAGSRWEFAIVLDTHASDLGDDLLQSTTLTAADGRALKPAGWAGAAAGGHHREGVLSFDVPAPRPAVVELRMVRPGESAPRIFRWPQ